MLLKWKRRAPRRGGGRSPTRLTRVRSFSLRTRRFRLPADDGGSLVNEMIVGQGFDHKQGEIDAAGVIAREDGIADMFTPAWKPFACAFLQIAPAHNRPFALACKDPATGFDLIIEIDEAQHLRDPAADFQGREKFSRIDVFPVFRDVPAAGKDQPRVRLREIEDSLGRARSVVPHSPRHEHGEHAIAAPHCLFDHRPIVRLAGHDRNAIRERRELPDTLRPAHADHFMVSLKAMLDHVLAQFAGGTDNTDFHDRGSLRCVVRRQGARFRMY